MVRLDIGGRHRGRFIGAGDGAMNRSAVREFVAPGVSVAPGEVLVPTEVGDAVRGPLPSPAAPLVAGTLLRKGTQRRPRACRALR